MARPIDFGMSDSNHPWNTSGLPAATEGSVYEDYNTGALNRKFIFRNGEWVHVSTAEFDGAKANADLVGVQQALEKTAEGTPEQRAAAEQAKLEAQTRSAIGLQPGETAEQFALRQRTSKFEPDLQNLLTGLEQVRAQKLQEESRSLTSQATRAGGAAEAPIAQAGLQGALTQANQGALQDIQQQKVAGQQEVSAKEQATRDAVTQALLNLAMQGHGDALNAYNQMRSEDLAQQQERKAKLQQMAEANAGGFLGKYGGSVGSVGGMGLGALIGGLAGGPAGALLGLGLGGSIGGAGGGIAQTLASGGRRGGGAISSGISGLSGLGESLDRYNYLRNQYAPYSTQVKQGYTGPLRSGYNLYTGERM